MIVSEITLYNTLKISLGEREAQVVVEGIKGAVKEEFDTRKDILATKDDIGKVREEMAKMETRMIKWMFIFVLGLFFSLTTVIFAMFNIYLKH